MLVYKRWLTEGIAQLSYLVGDDGTHTAAVIDPHPDVEMYLEFARAHELAITHIFETHIHADFMSGSRELAGRLGNASIYASGEGDTSYGFDVRKLNDGDTFSFGSAVLRARHTPGHTPEHMSYEVCKAEQPDRPWGVFTGDSLFVDSAGRPDLLGGDQTEELVEKLFGTIRDYYLKLEDDVEIFPCHGKGSACGPNIGERLSSTIGYERKFNKFCQIEDRSTFKDMMLGDAPPAPAHYPRLKKVNREGPPILGAGPVASPLPPEAFAEALQQPDVQLVDTRHMLAFGGGHIAGALNLGMGKPEMSVFAGWMLDADKPILLVLENDTQLERAVSLLVRTGFTKFAGYLAGGMTAWDNEGRPLKHVQQMTADELAGTNGQLQVLDVRQDDEWEQGHIPEARHQFVGKMRDDEPIVDKNKPVVTYCATGYRASLATSVLQRRGYEDVRNFPGSWQAWQATGKKVAD